nr:unnamed protein product [Callosobruchus chinensis]
MQNILQWNCNGCISHLNELRIMLKEYDPFCISLQETHFKPTSPFSLRGYNIYRKDVDATIRAKGGVAIFLKSNIGAKEILLDTNIQVVAVTIEAPLNVTLCSIYLPDGNWNIEQLQYIVERLPRPYIIMGDFNAHSPLWGSQRKDQRGRIIESLLETSEITLLNTGEVQRRAVRPIGDPALTCHLQPLSHRCGVLLVTSHSSAGIQTDSAPPS